MGKDLTWEGTGSGQGGCSSEKEVRKGEKGQALVNLWSLSLLVMGATESFETK